MSNDPISTGTTILAFKYKDGIMVAADSRTSSGNYVVSRITDKINLLAENIFICVSGSAADTQLIIRLVQSEIKKLSLLENTVPSVEKAAKLISKIIYENKEYLTAAIIVAGYDDSPKIFKINVCGSLEANEDIVLGGSGSAFIFGYCDQHYRPSMSLHEALDFARTSVGLAIRRDVFSGGVIRIGSITKSQTTRYLVSGETILDQ